MEENTKWSIYLYYILMCVALVVLKIVKSKTKIVLHKGIERQREHTRRKIIFELTSIQWKIESNNFAKSLGMIQSLQCLWNAELNWDKLHWSVLNNSPLSDLFSVVYCFTFSSANIVSFAIGREIEMKSKRVQRIHQQYVRDFDRVSQEW